MKKGIPTPLAHTYMIAPRSRMDILSEVELDDLVNRSKLIPKYNKVIDRESAYEMLNDRLNAASNKERSPAASSRASSTATAKPKEEKSWIETALNSSAGKQVQRSVVRTLFGVISKMFK